MLHFRAEGRRDTSIKVECGTEQSTVGAVLLAKFTPSQIGKGAPKVLGCVAILPVL